MAENPKSVCDSGALSSFSCQVELGDMGTQKMEISPDSFVVDIESLSHDHGVDAEDTSANSRISMERSLCRKGTITTDEGASGVAEDGSSNGESCYSTAEKSMVSPMGYWERKKDETAIKTHVVLLQKMKMMIVKSIIKSSESKHLRRPYRRQRSYSARLIDPRRVLFFFATLSSLGTIILIYFSLSVARMGDQTSQT